MTLDTYLKENYRFCPRCGAKLQSTTDHLFCGTCGFNFYYNPAPAVAMAVFHNEEVLLATRKYEPHQGRLDTVGGFVDPGETVEAAVLREFQEESNSPCRIKRYLDSFADHYGQDGFITLNLYFEVEVADLSKLKAGDDVEKLEFFPIREINEEDLAFDNAKQFIKNLKEGKYD